MGDGLLLDQKVVVPHRGGETRGIHQLVDGAFYFHKVDLAPHLRIGTHHGFQHVDAADVHAVDILHTQKQEALARMPFHVGADQLLHMVDRPKIEIPHHGDDPQLGAGRLLRLVQKVFEVVRGQHGDHLGGAGLQNIIGQGHENAGHDGKLQGQQQGGHQGGQHNGRVLAAGVPDAHHLLLIDHAVGDHHQHGGQGSLGDIGRGRSQQ